MSYSEKKTRKIQEKREALARAEAETRRTDERFMRQALTQAKKAGAINEVPIGCVIVREGRVIARGYNRRNTDASALAHAEISAIRKACKKTGDWRLEDCTIYITLEPCPMCAGAIVQSRIRRCVIGAMNPKAGCAGSVCDLLHVAGFNHRVETVRGILADECGDLLSSFFARLRESRKGDTASLTEGPKGDTASLTDSPKGDAASLTDSPKGDTASLPKSEG